MLGGELRWEEQRLPRARMCVDRAGTVDDMSEGFSLASPPPGSGTTGGVHAQRSSRPGSTNVG
jgi:hypothetical protein